MKKKIKKPNGVVLSLPLIISFFALAFVLKGQHIYDGSIYDGSIYDGSIYDSSIFDGSLLLSPPETNMILLFAIIIFIAGYVAFLIFLFSDNIREFLHTNFLFYIF